MATGAPSRKRVTAGRRRPARRRRWPSGRPSVPSAGGRGAWRWSRSRDPGPGGGGGREAEGLGCPGHHAVREDRSDGPWAGHRAGPPPWLGPNLLKFSSVANLQNRRVHIDSGLPTSLSNLGRVRNMPNCAGVGLSFLTPFPLPAALLLSLSGLPGTRRRGGGVRKGPSHLPTQCTTWAQE